MRILFTLMLLSLTGCASAKLVQKNYDPKSGVVAVTGNLGHDAGIEKANDVMASFCAPQGYKLVSESSGRQNTGMQFNRNANGMYATPTSKKQTELSFICK